MERRTLFYIQKILDEGSISSAAKKLFISQPSLSQFIKRIEDELGVEILERKIKPLQLTSAGEIFLKTEQSIHHMYEQGIKQIMDLSELKRGQVTIGSTNYRTMYLLTQVLPAFKYRYPGIDIHLEEGVTEELEIYVLNGITEISITLLPLTYPSLAFEELFQEQIVLALPANHPLCKTIPGGNSSYPPYPEINFSQLKNEPFIVIKKGQKIRASFFNLCHSTKISPNIILETDSMATAQALVASGMGITILPDTLAINNVFPVMPRYFSLKQVKPRKIGVVFLKGKKLSKASLAFIDVMKEVIEYSKGKDPCVRWK
jgi:DNA-binding transcriptional LysR family regulator